MKIGYYIRQCLKMILQHIYLPIIYRIYAFSSIEKGLVIFADAHHDDTPFSMEMMHQYVERLQNIRLLDMYLDFQSRSIKELYSYLRKFMKAYAKAEYVFICDNFLPVSSCKKRKQTKVIQLWHSGGLLKKAGYDVEDTVPSMYKGNVYANYDLLTVSAPCCIDPIQRSMRQPDGVVRATGVSRTDIYRDDKYNSSCVDEFYHIYPEARDKHIAIWMPTFRGNATDPKLAGADMIDRVFAEKDDWFLVKKLHPHYENKNKKAVTCTIPSERLLAVADLLITDYSSILFDYLSYSKPFVLFAPDLEEFERSHGFYVDYYSFPTTVAVDEKSLSDAVEHEYGHRDASELTACYDYHMQMCDGHATERILEVIGLI